jgi:hypothetical protein
MLRRQIHDRFGGSRQGGIAPCRRSPNILIFSDPEVGEHFGYDDHWEGDVFHYVGHGQRGDQEMTRGNLAILQHRERGLDLRVFQGVRGEIRYVGRFELDVPPTYLADAPGMDGRPRKVIVFRLRAAGIQTS